MKTLKEFVIIIKDREDSVSIEPNGYSDPNKDLMMKIFFLSFQGGLLVGLEKLFISIVALMCQIFLLQKRKREDFPQRRGSNLEGQTCILTTMKERIKNMIEEEQNQ
ncbi:hypothetical protein WN944_027429 [Citrus x changshan-huyou]|uniref:Uncharacterized protein n=1 Tax=Citrus x changshan-huyou TaxID=2935761 RepID=A0AAP0LJZ2_9ROSI